MYFKLTVELNSWHATMPQVISFGVMNTIKILHSEKQEQVFIRRPKKVQVHRREENSPFLSDSKTTTKAFRVRTFSFSLQGFLWEKQPGRQTPQLMLIVLQWSTAEVVLRASKASDKPCISSSSGRVWTWKISKALRQWSLCGRH